MKKRIFTVILFLCAVSSAWGAIEYKGATSGQIEAMYKEALSAPDGISTEEQGYIKIKVPSKNTFYYFTTKSHPCHPAVVVQKIYEEKGSLWIKAEGFTAGDRSKFEQWLRAFEQQHKRIQEQLNAGKSGS